MGGEAVGPAKRSRPTARGDGASLRQAQERTADTAFRWTEPRCRAYEILAEGAAPIKAYELMKAMGDPQPVNPPTVYRALDALEAIGLVHRLPSLNAFVACSVTDGPHFPVFLICDRCGSVEEFPMGAFASIAEAAGERGFQSTSIAAEVRGLCPNCR